MNKKSSNTKRGEWLVDVGFVILPFVLTGLFIVVGYQILIQNTPEARINPLPDQETVELLEENDVVTITPQNERPVDLAGPIVTLPQTEAELEVALDQAQQTQASVIFLSVPVRLEADNSFVLEKVELSNEENLKRWAKLTISAAHQRGLHVILAMSLNASMTVKDPATFAVSYSSFVSEWASLANEYAVSFFIPGVTVGHPLYSEIDTENIDKILGTIQRKVREVYFGKFGLGLCCTDTVENNLTGVSLINLIPTPEYTFSDLNLVVTDLEQTYPFEFVTYYEPGGAQLTSRTSN